MIYLRNRYYEPTTGRFITEDPYWNVDNMIYGDKSEEITLDKDYQNEGLLNVALKNKNHIVYTNTGNVQDYYDINTKLPYVYHISDIEEVVVPNPIYKEYQYYDNELKTIDVSAITQSSNLYIYCCNDAVNNIDSSGNFAVTTTFVATVPTWLPYVVGGITAMVGGVIYYKEHTKGARGSTYDKHTKKRPGAPSKASKKKGWKNRSNKNRP